MEEERCCGQAMVVIVKPARLGIAGEFLQELPDCGEHPSLPSYPRVNPVLPPASAAPTKHDRRPMAGGPTIGIEQRKSTTLRPGEKARPINTDQKTVRNTSQARLQALNAARIAPIHKSPTAPICNTTPATNRSPIQAYAHLVQDASGQRSQLGGL
jgi:hypothetical protein